MKTKIKSFAIWALMLSAIHLTAQADTLRNGELPAWASWYAHLNLHGFQTTELGQLLMQEMDIQETIDDVVDEIGWDIRDDILGSTVLGEVDEEGPAAVVLHGQVPSDAIDRVLQRADQELTLAQNSHGGVTYHSVTPNFNGHKGKAHARDDDRAFHVAFGPDQSLVSRQESLIHDFIDQGLQLTQFAANANELIVIEAERALIQGGLANGAGHHHAWNSSMLKNVDRISAAMIEQQGDLLLTAQVEATSTEMAATMANVIQGILALKVLDAADEPLLTELSEQLSVDQSESTIHLDLMVRADQLKQAID